MRKEGVVVVWSSRESRKALREWQCIVVSDG